MARKNKKQPQKFGEPIPCLNLVFKRSENAIYRDGQNLEFNLKLRYKRTF